MSTNAPVPAGFDPLDPEHALAGRVPRYAHGSRVPGWDDAVDLGKEPAVIPDAATTEVPAELREQIELAMSKYPDRRSAVIPALHAAQLVHGWCSPEAMNQVAAVMQLTPGYLTSIATFYDMFDTSPVGRHRVYVCTNISCSLRGADGLLTAFQRASEGEEDINVRGFECLGACDIAPMASVDGVYIGPLTDDDAQAICADLLAGADPLPAKQLLRRRSVDPGASGRTDAAGLPGGADPVDRPGPTAAIELTQEPVDEEETS